MPEQELISVFIDLLPQPRAMSAYAIDSREYSHNAFLHFLLRQRFGVALLQELSTKALATNPASELWKSVATTAVRIDPEFNVQRERRRPDELIVVTLAGGREVHVIVEMKVEAEGGYDQLIDYMEAQRHARPGVDVAGILLRIPGTDRIEITPRSDAVLIDGREYREAIAATVGRSKPFHERLQMMVNDYQDSLKYLETCDELIAKHGHWLQENRTLAPVQAWLDDRWRWVQALTMRHVALVLKKETGMSWPAELRKDANGSFLASPLDEGLTVGTEGDGAHLFFNWRFARGFEVHSITWPYQGENERARTLKDRLWQAARPILQKQWQERGTFPIRQGSSRMVGRLPDETWDSQAIAERFREAIADVRPLLLPVVDSVRRLGI